MFYAYVPNQQIPEDQEFVCPQAGTRCMHGGMLTLLPPYLRCTMGCMSQVSPDSELCSVLLTAYSAALAAASAGDTREPLGCESTPVHIPSLSVAAHGEHAHENQQH